MLWTSPVKILHCISVCYLALFFQRRRCFPHGGATIRFPPLCDGQPFVGRNYWGTLSPHQEAMMANGPVRLWPKIATSKVWFSLTVSCQHNQDIQNNRCSGTDLPPNGRSEFQDEAGAYRPGRYIGTSRIP
ncbi:hypothetical protein MLD38_012924 [Melastoma candidum]|uniref:Uncharacterized protein n=1 Tax=Melastoma candidum TaxID=119954 RepID=A0ACB9R828_9MYRT|nr:hypothetical protein MLD38_012924 [Melastoma candidum]